MTKSSVVRESIGTWWKISDYSPKFEPIDAVAFTASFVTHRLDWWGKLVERRESRDDIYPTFMEAKLEAIRRSEQRIASAKGRLHLERTFLGQIQSLQEPKP